MSDEQKDFLNMLEPLNVEARYPTYKEKLFRSLDTTRCLDILNNTEKLYLWIKSRLPMIEPVLLEEENDPSGFLADILKTGEIIYSV